MASAPYVLPPLPYPLDGLEPFYDKATLEVHHGKHHAAYVSKLNDALINHPDLATRTVEELVSSLDSLPVGIRAAIGPRLTAWMQRVDALPYFERTVPPHWKK